MDINTKAFNYGSWLHSYAFQSFLNKNPSLFCEIIDYKRPDQEGYNLKNPASYFLKNKDYKNFLKFLLFRCRYLAKYKKFKNFLKSKMFVSKTRFNKELLSSSSLDYDILICNSDTIWTPRKNGCFDEAYFLALPSMEGIPKIAYSPSMGNAVFPNSLDNLLKQYLEDFSYISCRESYEKKVLEKYTSKEVTHVLDPVFLLDKTEYLELIKKPYHKEKYILIYQPVDKSEQLVLSALEYAKKRSLKVIEISTEIYRKTPKTITVDYKAGPIDFISAINSAECVFTNSFHAICFSIIFNKQFFAFGRKDNLKVVEICKRFSLSNRYSENGCLAANEIDFSLVSAIKDKLINISKEWLINAIFSCSESNNHYDE